VNKIVSSPPAASSPAPSSAPSKEANQPYNQYNYDNGIKHENTPYASGQLLQKLFLMIFFWQPLALDVVNFRISDDDKAGHVIKRIQLTGVISPWHLFSFSTNRMGNVLFLT